jgi:uncharacterized membrane protein YdjX (TVP38/TMEM64 family)
MTRVAAAVRRPLRRLPWRWFGVGLIVVALFVAWHVLPVDDWVLSLQHRIARMGVLGAVVFALVYAAAALLFVPGSVLTIAAGALFGLGWGTAVASAASTGAAASAFLISRYLARARIEQLAQAHEKFGAIDRAIREKGWKVVALLRLNPVVPFSLCNYLYGLTAVGFWPYLLASWAAMLPGTVLYVSLGAAGRAAAVGKDGGRTPGEWALLGAGIVATIVVTVLLTRAARRELAKIHLDRKA